MGRVNVRAVIEQPIDVEEVTVEVEVFLKEGRESVSEDLLAEFEGEGEVGGGGGLLYHCEYWWVSRT